MKRRASRRRVLAWHAGDGATMTEYSRRAWLARAAAGGAGLALAMAEMRRVLAADLVKKGVARLRGEARIGGRPAQQGMPVTPGDVVTTGPDSELVFVVGRNAFLARADSRIELSASPAEAVVAGLRIVTGALLSVFEPGREKRIRTSIAIIGIRGTGVYVEVETARTYVCTCYGEARLVPLGELKAAETVRTTHHDQPRYIYSKGAPRMIEQAPVVNHSDAELILLESLVGRKVPFDPARY